MREQLEKAPRWFLVMVTTVTVSALGLIGTWTIRQVFADVDTIKGVAYQARSTATKADEGVQRLEKAVEELKDGNETFRKEYREDQKDLDKKLGELLLAVKK